MARSAVPVSTARPAVDVVVVVGGLLLSGGLLAAADLVADAATGHVRLHAATAAAFLLPALGILAARPLPTFATRIPVAALALVAAAQLTESIGAFGYAADNDTRVRGIAAAHDLGLMATGFAALFMALALGVAAAGLVRRSWGRVTSLIVATAVGAAGLFAVKVLVGL